MKSITTLFVCLCICKWTGAEFESEKFPKIEHVRASGVTLETGTFETKLDHFRPQDPRMVSMQYQANFNNYFPAPTRPLYVYIKNVSDNSTRWIEEGLMVDIARNNYAALFTFDQRYFGENLIFDEFSWENFEYLTFEQSIADIATFIEHIRTSLDVPFAPVVLWGSKLGATLAAWTRLKYPHLVNGVWSSSGIFEINYQTFAYYNLIAYTLAQSSTDCRYRVQYAFEYIEEMIENNQSDALQRELNLCDPLDTNSVSEVAMVLERLIDLIIGYIDQFHFHGVQNFCHDINAIPSSPLQSIMRWARFVYNTNDECFDFSYNRAVDRYANSMLGRQAWNYFQCTQAGTFRITDTYNWLSERITLDYRMQYCRDVLGDQYNESHLFNAIADLELQFGGYYQYISNIVYTNGYIDPWLYDGIVSTGAPNASVINIDYYSSSADLTSLNGWDSGDLTAAKRTIRNYINEWSGMEF